MKRKWFMRFAQDSIWTMLGLTAMNGVAQFIVYPYIRSFFGVEAYGRILTMLAVVNLVAITIGTSLNNTRLVAKSRGTGQDNSTYIRFLGIVIVGVIALCPILYLIWGEPIRSPSFLLYGLLMAMTIVKYYSEVEYRLSTNYIGLFIYYAVISLGYLAGVWVMKATGEWTTSLLVGETIGFIYVCLWGNIYRKSSHICHETLKDIWRSSRYLMSAQLLVNLIYNSDRFILLAFCGSTAVATFYIASAVGKMISLLTGAFNSVIIGHLTQKKDEISREDFRKIFVVVSLVVLFLSIACYFGSMIYARWLYPEDYLQARPYFYIANLAQVLYFASGVFATILLRYEKESIQTKINVIYLIVFGVLTVGASKIYGIWGYAVGILISNLARYLYASYLCHKRLQSV